MGKPIFEHKTCGRCGGSGNYSYCQTHGTTCFNCNGSGVSLTARGLLAQNKFRASCSKLAREIKVGDFIREDSGRFDQVTFVGYKAESGGYHRDGKVVPFFYVETARCSHGGFEYSLFRVKQTPEEHKIKIAIALEYQATLSQNGKAKLQKASV